MKLSPSVFTAPVPARVARGLVLVGNLLHSIGASMLTDQNEDLADELERARADVDDARRERDELAAELAPIRAALNDGRLEMHGAVIGPGGDVDELDEHQGADVDEHQGAGLDVPDWVRP